MEIPESVQKRIDRGVKKMRTEAPKRNVAMEFWRGNHFAYLNSEGNMTFMPTSEPEKPRHRYRLSHNLYFDLIEREVSRTTQRVPGYEVTASTWEPNDYYAAKTSEKVGRSQYPVWKLHRATEKVVRSAVVQDMGFAWPYFDNQKGTQIAEGVAEGEICVETYSPNEVFWEPGVEYEKSRWMGIQQAKPLDEVRKLAPGIELKADAAIASTGGANTNKQRQAEYLVMTTEYFERPSMEDAGKWLTCVNKQVIAEASYPVLDTQKNPLDEPVLVPLSYAVDPDSDTDMGLGRHLVDPMRIIVDCINKILQWKNMALNPQIIIRNGVWKGPKLNDAPGMVYRVFGNADPVFREVPRIPPELFTLIDQAREDMNRIAGQAEPPSGMESGKGLEAWDTIQERRASFIGKLAEFHATLMRRCLTLVQLYYSEERLLKIQGRYGPEILSAFKGADLRSQVDVTVRPGSLEPRSKEAVKQELMNLVQMFPGAFSPEQVMAAMEQGTAEKLLESYELDVRRAHEIIQKIKAGPEVLFNEPHRPLAPGEGTKAEPEIDPTGQPTGRMVEQPILDPETKEPITDVPGWLPRPFDNTAVQKKVVQDFAKTSDFDMLEDGMKAATFQYLAALDEAEQREAEKAQMEVAQKAEQIGMRNASEPPPKPIPSLPSLNGT